LRKICSVSSFYAIVDIGIDELKADIKGNKNEIDSND
jgi:hypothetical protein